MPRQRKPCWGACSRLPTLPAQYCFCAVRAQAASPARFCAWTRVSIWGVALRGSWEENMATDSMEETGVLETDAVLVRTMRQDDLNAIVAIDAAASGRRRPRYFELMLQRSITQAGLQISLVAEVDNRVVGFVIGSLYYGEYGVAEPSASIDAISVDPRNRGKNVGKALMRQLRLNLGALRITTLRTEVSWDHFDLLGFFRSQGFKPSTRICLECTLDPTRPEESADE